MDYDKRIDLLHEAEEDIWFERVLKTRSDGSLCAWASSLHPQQLSCHLDGNFLNGPYNIAQKLLFEDSTALILRFPRVSSVSHRHADEKVAMEVEALRLIRQETALPVPEVWVWGGSRYEPPRSRPIHTDDLHRGYLSQRCFDFKWLTSAKR